MLQAGVFGALQSNRWKRFRSKIRIHLRLDHVYFYRRLGLVVRLGADRAEKLAAGVVAGVNILQEISHRRRSLLVFEDSFHNAKLRFDDDPGLSAKRTSQQRGSKRDFESCHVSIS